MTNHDQPQEIADIEVTSKLHSRAVGYQYTEQQTIKRKRGTNQEEVVVIDVTKEVPPDPTSCYFWLKNRHPDKGQT